MKILIDQLLTEKHRNSHCAFILNPFHNYFYQEIEKKHSVSSNKAHFMLVCVHFFSQINIHSKLILNGVTTPSHACIPQLLIVQN